MKRDSQIQAAHGTNQHPQYLHTQNTMQHKQLNQQMIAQNAGASRSNTNLKLQNSSHKNLANGHSSVERDLVHVNINASGNRNGNQAAHKLSGMNGYSNSQEPSSPQIAFQNHKANYQQRDQAGKLVHQTIKSVIDQAKTLAQHQHRTNSGYIRQPADMTNGQEVQQQMSSSAGLVPGNNVTTNIFTINMNVNLL